MSPLKVSLALTSLLALSVLAADPAPGASPQAVPAAAAPVQSTQAQSPQANLATATVALHTIPREYRLDGLVEAVNQSTVSAQTQGQVQEILYDVDDYVEKGTVILRLKDTEHRARVAQAQADLKSAAAQLKQTHDDYVRYKGLFDKKSVSQSAMDKATADLASAQAAMDAAQARLEQAQEQLKYTEVRAPYAGIMTERKVAVGEMASPGKPLVSGISLDTLRIRIEVPQSLITEVRHGTLARVYLADGTVIESKAITVFPYADPDSNTFKVRVDLPTLGNKKNSPLFPGMFVKTGFVVGERTELTVPKSAVVHRSEVTGVYVVGEGERVQFRQVRLGRVMEDGAVVLAGLSEGERVALDPIAAGVVLKAQAAARQAAGGHHG
jgi:RND family efflux transporter MFP subunit